MNTPLIRSSVLLVLAAGIAGCSSVEYRIRESFGQQKRELLVDRVEAARESQEEAKEQFVSALAQFKSVTGFEGGDLERRYNELDAEFQSCVTRADAVRKRIAAVEDVANALFREWERELDDYTSASLRQTSESQLQQTRSSYQQLIAVMRTAERRMEPVLATFRDQVLFLKHNLNARAVASLGNVSAELQRDIDVLVADMERAIADANRFIERMQSTDAGA